MKKLTKEQINEIAEWIEKCPFNNKNSISAEFRLAANQMLEKPALGLRPLFAFQNEMYRKRQEEILSALDRYTQANQKPPQEWLDEYMSYFSE